MIKSVKDHLLSNNALCSSNQVRAIELALNSFACGYQRARFIFFPEPFSLIAMYRLYGRLIKYNARCSRTLYVMSIISDHLPEKKKKHPDMRSPKKGFTILWYLDSAPLRPYSPTRHRDAKSSARRAALDPGYWYRPGFAPYNGRFIDHRHRL